ncbi:hypothetical protein CBS147323_8169 [Aspergillus niger]|nr:hypothetical protein CBS133816_1019 [Aspergillus niger]KAI2838241.1 hypothetical protein CBS11350_8301 [Aspergillus niger]KAI2960098.1 hypothetical protein CBS147323_8169 [Aspergillus niger]KAI2964628.1 hypothetical protein CBS147324_8422 [Aspergillus niger]KAI2982534.1 hypothetical protein CBS147344_8600 [Aspergillus niger]
MPAKDLKVVIVGGSIAGLLLANALARQGIDFIVLEGRLEVAPCDGAGLCVLSSGARILDQLGVFEDIQAYGGPISVQRIWRDDGQLLGHTETLALIPVRYNDDSTTAFRSNLQTQTTPNLGQGGNGAIESAASLANTIVSIAHSVKLESLSVPKISASLDEWARSRQRRMKLICDLGNSFTRLEAFHTLKDKALGLYLGKYQVDAIADILCDTTVGAEKLSFLPLPEKSAHVTMPFDPEKGIHAAPRVRSLMLRALLPFILIFAVQPTVRGFMNSRILKPVSISYEHEAQAFDFLGYDINYQSIQALAAMSRIADLGAILGIWALESCRTGNVATLMSL